MANEVRKRAANWLPFFYAGEVLLTLRFVYNLPNNDKNRHGLNFLF